MGSNPTEWKSRFVAGGSPASHRQFSGKPMIIQINSDWRVRSGSDQYILEHRAVQGDKPRKGDGWRAFGYFSSVNEIWPVLARKQIRSIEIKGVLPASALEKLDIALETILAEMKAAIINSAAIKAAESPAVSLPGGVSS